MENAFDLLKAHYPELEPMMPDIRAAYEVIKTAYENGGKLMICGNGGSAADALHMVGELMKGFKLKRAMDASARSRFISAGVSEDVCDKLQGGLPAISLMGELSLVSAFCNDVDPTLIYAQQIYALGKPGDVLLGISTSGNAENIAAAIIVAKAMKIRTIGLTGRKRGRFRDLCDISIRVPADETYRVQEYHLPVYHAVCAELEQYFFGKTQ